MWIVGMCFPGSACEVLSCLGESEAGVHLSIMDDQYKYWWVVVVGEFQSCCLSVDVWQILVAPTEVAASVEPVLGAGVWVGAQFEPPGWHKCRFKSAELTKLTPLLRLPLPFSVKAGICICFLAFFFFEAVWFNSNQRELRLCTTSKSSRNKCAPMPLPVIPPCRPLLVTLGSLLSGCSLFLLQSLLLCTGLFYKRQNKNHVISDDGQPAGGSMFDSVEQNFSKRLYSCFHSPWLGCPVWSDSPLEPG